MLEIKVITKNQQHTSSWAGGTTTQIAIYPSNAEYAQRDFLWRLSSAKVEVEESTFTKLPGFDRILMVLNGTLELIHKEQHSVKLLQYEQDCFKGSWDTVSIGRARDFNLMLREGIKGHLKHYGLQQGTSLTVNLEAVADKKRFFACFCYEGDVTIAIGEREHEIQEGDMLLVAHDQTCHAIVTNNGQKKCSLIGAFILL